MPTLYRSPLRAKYRSTIRWVNAGERSPERNWTFLVCTRMGDVYAAHYDDGIWTHAGSRLVIGEVDLWADMPIAPWRRNAS